MSKITATQRAIINLHSIPSLTSWLKDQGIELPARPKNFFDTLEDLLKNKELTTELLSTGLAELEENSSKKVLLFEAKKFRAVIDDKILLTKVIKKKFGDFDPNKNFLIGSANRGSTFNYCYWGDDEIKIKLAETHVYVDVDKETGQVTTEDKRVIILFILNLTDGFAQIRFDTPGDRHTHKNEHGKSTSTAFEAYYRDLFNDFFEKGQLVEMNLEGVSRHIHDNVRDIFRLTKGLNTITNGDRLSVSSRSTKVDIRDSDEYKRIMSSPDRIWRAEDLTGYWIEATSKGQLAQDLYMRLSRKESNIKVQRGCTAKELNYGLDQIKSIKGAL